MNFKLLIFQILTGQFFSHLAYEIQLAHFRNDISIKLDYFEVKTRKDIFKKMG